jgi:hypothetical protein
MNNILIFKIFYEIHASDFTIIIKVLITYMNYFLNCLTLYPVS